MTGKVEWVVWNGSMGILDMAAIGLIEGRSAFLAPPYNAVGPFSLDELEKQGRTYFGECLIMSRLRWQEDQTTLRLDARRRRQAILSRLGFDTGDEEHREALDLPPEGPLDASSINAAFRRKAKAAHPDAGGSNEQYRHITEARDALLKLRQDRP